jgi:hypothetical protein
MDLTQSTQQCQSYDSAAGAGTIPGNSPYDEEE